MYVLMTDETNLNPGAKSRFFIYGGLVFPVDTLSALDALVAGIRSRHGFSPADQFKFSTHTRPPQVTIDEWSTAKEEVILGCLQLGVTFIAYLILHDIARNRTRDELVGFGLNTILHLFGIKFLDEHDADGMVIVDRLPLGQDYDFLRTKFRDGLTIEPSGAQINLPRIKLYASTCDGASHASSAVDIVLGAFRYCVNRTGDTPVPQRLFPYLARMMWHRKAGDTRYIRDYGLALRPRSVLRPEYRSEYDALVQRFASLAGEVPDE
jgi:hypothetical protein